VTFVVGRDMYMLSKVERTENRQEQGGDVIYGIVKVSIKVTIHNEFMRCGSNKKAKKRI